MGTSMPAEHLTGIVGSVLGAVFVILGASGMEVSPEVAAALVTLVGWLATGVTWWIRRREGGPRIPVIEYPEDQPETP